MKKSTLFILLALSVLAGVIQIFTEIRCNYVYERDYLSSWALADKSSSLPAKAKYISVFVDAIKSGIDKERFAPFDAVFLETPNNSLALNLKALETLRDRMIEIQSLDPNSFQYNTAIQQITAQEQGEASSLTGVFQGCFTLRNYPIVWGWIGGLLIATELGTMFFVLIMVALEID